MKALYLEDIGKLVIKEIPYPKLPKGGLILKVKSAAICGTDLKIYKHGHKRIILPWILGHEISGTIEEVDDPTGYYKRGDRVVLNPTVYCGKCYYCKRGMYNICLSPDSYGYERPGGFVEYMPVAQDVVSRKELYRIFPDMGFNEAALTEPFACVMNGHKDIHIEPGTHVLIIGGGPIGIMHAIYAKQRGADNVYLYDINEERAERAGSIFYIDRAFSKKEKLIDAIKTLTSGIGPDVVIVAAPSTDAQQTAFEVARKRGEILFFAGIARGAKLTPIDTNLIHYKELKIFGSSNSTGLYMERALSFIYRYKIFFSSLITSHFPLTSAEEAFVSALSPSSYKVVINP